MVTSSKPNKLSSYHRRLFLFLSVATFFEGYDFLALTQILPALRADMALPPEASAYISGCINVGAVCAFLLVRLADQLGRRRVLAITIAGYTVFTLLTGLAPNIELFVAAQLVARVFLLAEWAVSMVIAAEEFPAERRGMVLGVVQASCALGGVICAGVVPLLLDIDLPWAGWRNVYFVGVVPLVMLAFFRGGLGSHRGHGDAEGGLRETKLFSAIEAPQKTSLFRIWSTPYRGRMLAMASVWFFTYIASYAGVTFWKEFVIHERNFSEKSAGAAVAVAALVAMPVMFSFGKVIDVIGRRAGAFGICTLGAVGIYGAYTLHERWLLTVCLMLGLVFSGAVLTVLNAFTTELFPTELRGDAFAWSNNLLGRISYVATPFVIGIAVEGSGQKYGPVVSMTAVFPLIALVLVYFLLPETSQRDLDETSQVST